MNKLQIGTAALLAFLILALVTATSLGFSRRAVAAMTSHEDVKIAQIAFDDGDAEVIIARPGVFAPQP